MRPYIAGISEETMAQFQAPLLQPFIRRLRLESFLKALILALATGIVSAFVVMLVMQVFALRYIWYVLLGLVAGVSLVTGIVSYFTIYRFSLKYIIRRIDEAGLQERVITMEELWGDMSYIAKLQRQDTLRLIKEMTLRAIRLQLPLVAGIVLLAVSVTTAGAAFIPPRQTRVAAGEPIYDDYKIIIPAVNELPDKLYEAVEQIPEKLPETIKDELKDIIQDIEDLNNGIMDGTESGDMDSVADLEDKIDRLDQILKENVHGPLVSDYMIRYAAFKALAAALKSARVEDVHNALYSWNFGFTQQLAHLAKNSAGGSSDVVKTAIRVQMAALMSEVVGNSKSFDDDRDKILAATETLSDSMMSTIFNPEGIETLMGNDPILKPLSDALLAGDTDAILDALSSIKSSLLNAEDGTINTVQLDAVILALNTVKVNTCDQPTGSGKEDAAWTAVYSLHWKLEQVSELVRGGAEDAPSYVDEAFVLASAYFTEAAGINSADAVAYEEMIQGLRYIHNGRYLYAYLWNDPENAAYVPSMGAGLAAELRKILDDDCGFDAAYKESELVNALYKLLDALEAAAENAAKGGGASNIMYSLFGATWPSDGNIPDAHTTHKEANAIPVACNEIFEALTIEEKLEDVVEDMKDQIQDAIDDLLNPDGEEEENPEEPDTGIDSKPSEPPPSGGESSDGEQNPDWDQQPPQDNPSGGTPSTGTNDYSGMTFFNPNTGEEEVLSEERLAEFKAALDKAIADGNYSDEEKNQMNLYYEYLLQKFSQK